ncbi:MULTISPECIES: DUF294 nucleotidyltransferase-like domain-containing protein [Bacillus]|uniref:DUF294 nucleotidyltransferase-like domain-containing protein n=1 Tax=Bacillus TaxID=1386 RepID=UPI0002EF6B2F|nr:MULTISPECIES: DUF294 nucleotidyltransferase-like domain-containing protein [Bacillus]
MKNSHAYEEIKQWKNNEIKKYYSSIIELNSFHDQVMKKVFQTAVANFNSKEPPSSFGWLITGSGGRFEQGLISDQDHGIVYNNDSEANQAYFLQLGQEISRGLDYVGYPYCKGNVMSSNPIWCRSLEQWKAQLYTWMKEENWESIRYLQIFLDSRCLVGEEKFCKELKESIFQYRRQHPSLIKRFVENVMHIKKAMNPLGQLLTSNVNGHKQSFDLKYAAFLPYVNAIRILSLQEGLYETSTLDRMEELLKNDHHREIIMSAKVDFQRLLEIRLKNVNGVEYEDSHFLKMALLDSSEKKEIKRIVKGGYKLHEYVLQYVKRVDSYGI